MKNTLILFVFFFSMTSAWGEGSVFSSLTGSNQSIIFKYHVNDEKKNLVFNKLSFKGFKSSIDSLVSFFYLSRENDLKSIVNMHYEGDGTRRYIAEMLYGDPKVFAGSDNLASIQINEVYKIGNHEVVSFKMKDKTGQQAPWFEDFVCQKGACKKTNFLNIFGNNYESKFINTFIRVKKEKIKERDLSAYKKISLDQQYFGDLNPLEVFFDVKKVDKNVKATEWYGFLEKIEKQKNLDSIEKKSNLSSYLPTIYNNWGEKKFVGSRFSRSVVEKSWLVGNLAVVTDFKVKYYLDTKTRVWVFASSKRPDGKPSNYFFAFDKKSKKYLMNPSRSAVGALLMNEKVEAMIFPKEKETEDEEAPSIDSFRFKPKHTDAVIKAFLDQLK